MGPIMGPMPNLHSYPVLCVAAVTLALALFPGRLPATEPAFSAEARSVAEALGYDDKQLAKLLDGEIVTHRFRKEAENELSVTLAMVAPQPVDVVYRVIEKADMLEADRTILAWGKIAADSPSADSFQGLTLPDEELAQLVEVEAGSNFNLSSEEIAGLRDVSIRLREAPEQERKSKVMQHFRELLAERVRAYQQQGIAGVAGYARKKGNADPAADLRHSVPPATGLLARDAPDFYRALKGDPGSAPSTVQSSFIWLLQELNGRPAVVLAHRILGGDGGNTFFAQRDFYVGHTFDALQLIVGCFGLAEESVVFYANSTYTEQVTGFGSGAAHAIGRKIMTAEVIKLFESIRAELRKRSS
jgi:hypothetical protein